MVRRVHLSPAVLGHVTQGLGTYPHMDRCPESHAEAEQAHRLRQVGVRPARPPLDHPHLAGERGVRHVSLVRQIWHTAVLLPRHDMAHDT